MKLIVLLTLYFFSFSLFAENYVGELFRLSGRLESLTGWNSESGQLVIVESREQWFTSYRVIGDGLSDSGPLLRSSNFWFDRRAQPVELPLTEVAKLVVSNLKKEPVLNSPSHCIPSIDSHSVSSEAQSDTIEFFKNLDQRRSYFQCYRSSHENNQRYRRHYEEGLETIAQTYSQLFPPQAANDIHALMSCLIFRESGGWQGGRSHTGALGLGQFTTIAMNQVKNIISYNGRDNFDQRIETQYSEHRAGRLSEQDLNANIRLIEAERRNYLRMSELKMMWENIPLQNRPTANDLNAEFFSNNENHQAIFALSSLLIRDCQIRADQANIVLDDQLSLLACAGSYNMGYGAFSSNALNRNSESQGIEDWVENLRSSGHRQAQETSNHIISISRCTRRDENYPPCGTRVDHCQDLLFTNPCRDNARPLCSNEDCS